MDAVIYIADCDTRVWRNCPEVEVPERKEKRGPHPERERIAEGEPEPVEAREIAEEFPEEEKERVFLRDTERKELWSKMMFLRMYQP